MTSDLFISHHDPILSATTYTDFKHALLASNCTRCELCKGRSQIVVDRGNPCARVMIVGEAPGRNEDLQGKAFVGRAGKLLDGLLKDLGFDTNQDAIICNVAKCRPPDNRQPKPAEIEACRPFLNKQIELVKPKVILLLGAVALRRMIAGKQQFSMADEVGKFFDHPDYPGAQLMVLYHPAYILRDPRKKPLMIQHLETFKEHWNSLVAVTG